MDCEKVMSRINDSTDPLYADALYTSARMHLDLCFDHVRADLQQIWSVADSLNVEDLKKSYKLYINYIEIVENADRMVSNAHYRAGFCSFLLDFIARNGSDTGLGRLKQARHHYQRGLSAEKDRLSFF